MKNDIAESFKRKLDKDPEDATLKFVAESEYFESLIGEGDGEIYHALICTLHFLVNHPCPEQPEELRMAAIKYLYFYQGMAIQGHSPWLPEIH